MTDDIRDQIAEALPAHWGASDRTEMIDALMPVVKAYGDAREEAGRRSVGLGDFVVTHCDEEIRSPYVLDAYGEWLECTRREGHDGDHEHSDSGYTWDDR